MKMSVFMLFVLFSFTGFSQSSSSDTCALYVDNSFSPNGDRINDCFQPSANCTLEELKFKVYNRWGELVYETTDPNECWDGTYKSKTLPVGTYFWNATVVFAGEEKSYTGYITLVR